MFDHFDNADVTKNPYHRQDVLRLRRPHGIGPRDNKEGAATIAAGQGEFQSGPEDLAICSGIGPESSANREGEAPAEPWNIRLRQRNKRKGGFFPAEQQSLTRDMRPLCQFPELPKLCRARFSEGVERTDADEIVHFVRRWRTRR
jgi:hypothetical protein